MEKGSSPIDHTSMKTRLASELSQVRGRACNRPWELFHAHDSRPRSLILIHQAVIMVASKDLLPKLIIVITIRSSDDLLNDRSEFPAAISVT
jgi:hypothetical protein